MVKKKSIVFVVNPISGTTNKRSIVRHIEEGIDKQKYNTVIKHTEYAGHAVEIAAECVSKGIEIVVAIGGDGTVNEVARSLVHTQTALGIIPCGSGNGLARHLQIPMDVKGAIDVINKGVTECVDFGKINNIPFFCTCGVGFDAFVSLKFASSRKRGLLTYLENTLRESLKYKPDTYEIEDENGTFRYKAFLIACANASQYGNNVYIAPQASMCDGLMDVIILQPFTVLDVPTLALQLFTKKLDKSNLIKTIRCKKIHIHREHEGVIHFDGDPIMTGENIDVELFSKGLNIVVNNTAEGHETNFLQIFADYFNELNSIPGKMSISNLSMSNKRISVLNRELLRKLTKR